MATIRILLGILWLAALGCDAKPDRRVLTVEQPLLTEPFLRRQILSIARSQLHIKEATGKNDGPQIARYLQAAGLPEGYPWCAAFVSWVYQEAGFSAPRTAWSPALFPKTRLRQMPESADVLGIYSPKLKRIAHCGLVEEQQGKWVLSIEGNTNTDGGREGNGVYRKRRHVSTIARFANWIDQQGGRYE